VTKTTNSNFLWHVSVPTPGCNTVKLRKDGLFVVCLDIQAMLQGSKIKGEEISAARLDSQAGRTAGIS
jgi:hypothetical protein